MIGIVRCKLTFDVLVHSFSNVTYTDSVPATETEDGWCLRHGICDHCGAEVTDTVIIKAAGTTAIVQESVQNVIVYSYSGIEPVTVGSKQMWHVTATNGKITYYYNNGNDEIANVQHTITFDELEHTYITSGSQRYYTDSVPATYDAAGSCVAHYPCRYCDEELTEEIVIDKLLYKVAVKDARL